MVMMMMTMTATTIMITLQPDNVKGQWSCVALAHHPLCVIYTHVGSDDSNGDCDYNDSNDDGDDDSAVPRQCEGPVEPCGAGRAAAVGHLHSCWW